MSVARDIQLEEGPFRLKLASKALVKAVHGGAVAAEITGSKQQRMSDCGLTHTREFLRLDEVLALEEAAQGSRDWPQVTRTMARLHGFALLPLPQTVPGNSDWHRSLSEVSQEAGEAVAKICSALSDGEVTADEIRDGEIVEEIDQAIAALARLRSLAEAVSSGGKPATLRAC